MIKAEALRVIIILVAFCPMQPLKPSRPILLQTGKSLSTAPAHPKRYGSLSHKPSPLATPTTLAKPPSHKFTPQGSRPTRPPAVAGLQPTMNDQFMAMRKDNHLTTHFNLRKHRQQEIIRQNQVLQQRINSQKSLYSSIDLNKSYQKTGPIRQRLSQSKLSRASLSSRSSERSRVSSSSNRKQDLKKGLKKKENRVEIRAASIEHTAERQINAFREMFVGGVTNRGTDSSKTHSTAHCPTRGSKVYTQGGLRAPKMVKTTGSRQSSYSEQQVVEPSNSAVNGGGLLHRIAEEMLQPAPAKNSSNNRKGYLRPIKHH